MAAPSTARTEARDAAAPPSDRAALTIAILYALATFAWYCVWKHFMAERSGDEPLFENCLWNAVHGHGLRTWLEGGRHHLAVHFSPALYLFVPVYAVVGTMHPIHLATSVATAAAGWLLYRDACRALDGRTAVALMAAFLLHPTIVLQTFMEFHEQALAPLPLILLVRAVAAGSAGWAGVWSLALLSLREDNLLVVLSVAALAALRDRRARVALALASVAVAWLVLYWRVSVVALGGGTVPGVFANTYGVWGDTPGAMAQAIVTQPLRVVRHLLSPAPIKYLAQLTAPLLVALPLADPVGWTAIPSLMLNLLAMPGTRPLDLRMHFSVAPAVLLYLGATGAIARLMRRRVVIARAGRRFGVASALVLAMLAVSIALSPFWIARSIERLNPFTAEARRMLATIPDTASVTAPAYLLNQIARRPGLAFEVSEAITTTSYVVLEDSTRRFYRGTALDLLASPRLVAILSRAGYQPVYDRDGWSVWRRTAAGAAPSDSSISR